MKLLVTVPYGVKLVLPTTALSEVEKWVVVRQIGYSNNYARGTEEGDKLSIELYPDEALLLTEEAAQEDYRKQYKAAEKEAVDARCEKYKLQNELNELRKKLEGETK